MLPSALFIPMKSSGIQTSIFKLITSSITIGGGLTSGREGPIAQIGAATGATIATLLKLTARERNIALAADSERALRPFLKRRLRGRLLRRKFFIRRILKLKRSCRHSRLGDRLHYCRRVHGISAGFHPPPQTTQFDRPVSLFCSRCWGWVALCWRDFCLWSIFTSRHF